MPLPVYYPTVKPVYYQQLGLIKCLLKQNQLDEDQIWI